MQKQYKEYKEKYDALKAEHADEVKKIMHNTVDAAFLDADQQAYLRELVDERLR